jgi:O-antigen ligase
VTTLTSEREQKGQRPADRPARRYPDVVGDLVGAALLVAAIGWTFVAAARSGGRPASAAVLLGACGLAWIVGRAVGSGDRRLIPAAVVLIALWLLATGWEATLDTSPLSGPFGYANAKASFFLQASLAALMLAASARGWALRITGAVAALALVAVLLVIRSDLVVGLALTLPPMALLIFGHGGRARARAAAGALGLLVVLALLGTTLLGASYKAGAESSPVIRQAYSLLSERRPALWSDAVDQLAGHPLSGVGPGRFSEESPVSRSDPDDARWAHNGFLQQGAEQGVPGIALLVLLFVWALARLGAVEGADRMTVLAATAVAALGIHACIDYVLHFGPLPITAAALAGSALSVRTTGARHA